MCIATLAYSTENTDSKEPYYSTVGVAVKSCKKKGECHFLDHFVLPNLVILMHVFAYSTANIDLEEPYYSTVNTEQLDAIEMKVNDAYGRPLPT